MLVTFTSASEHLRSVSADAFLLPCIILHHQYYHVNDKGKNYRVKGYESYLKTGKISRKIFLSFWGDFGMKRNETLSF